MKVKNILLVSALSILLTACNSGGSSEKRYDGKEWTIDEEYYANVEKRAGFDRGNTLNFVETFSGGMSDYVWNCIEGSWHTDVADAPHNGVRMKNLFYTKDSNNNDYLAIRALGYNDPSVNGKPEGGAIETINHLGPGRYEIVMAAMPREGGVTAMWTYCTTTGSEATSQNEIDIEIGGTTNGTQFEHEWCTSWTKKNNKQTNTPDITDILYLNDGRMHKFTFDWYTNYGSSKAGRVDWFIDEQYVDSIEGDVVPDHAMPLWVGVWFPPLWAGAPAFVEDYMIIDEIKYSAFDDTQYYDDCRSYVTYNATKPSLVNIQEKSYDEITKDLNKFSNASMESIEKSTRDGNYFGWEPDAPEKYTGTLSLSDEHTEGNKCFKLSASDAEENNGIYLGQAFSNSYSGYKYRLSIDAKKVTEESVGNIEISYRKNLVNSIGKSIIIPVTSTSFDTYTYDIVMPANAKLLKIYVTAEKGSMLYDNAQLYRVLD